MSELNPNHPVCQALNGRWHVILLMIMQKLGVTEIQLTEADMQVMLDGGQHAVMAMAKPEGLLIKIISMEEAEALAMQQGGRTH